MNLALKAGRAWENRDWGQKRKSPKDSPSLRGSLSLLFFLTIKVWQASEWIATWGDSSGAGQDGSGHWWASWQFSGSVLSQFTILILYFSWNWIAVVHNDTVKPLLPSSVFQVKVVLQNNIVWSLLVNIVLCSGFKFLFGMFLWSKF